MASSQQQKRKGKKFIRALTILKLTGNYSIWSKKQLLGIDMFIVGSYILETKTFAFSSFKSREKDEKVTLVTFNSFASLKGQVAR
jgi:hypothetical protein